MAQIIGSATAKRSEELADEAKLDEKASLQLILAIGRSFKYVDDQVRPRMLKLGLTMTEFLLEYINQLRARGESILDAAIDGSVLRLRPIMMTMLVASVGLLPAALSRGIGSDSQRPFAIVIVGGLIGALFLGVFLLPTLYVWVASDRDGLPIAEVKVE